jgi:translation initiation factor IF-1
MTLLHVQCNVQNEMGNGKLNVRTENVHSLHEIECIRGM